MSDDRPTAAMASAYHQDPPHGSASAALRLSWMSSGLRLDRKSKNNTTRMPSTMAKGYLGDGEDDHERHHGAQEPFFPG